MPSSSTLPDPAVCKTKHAFGSYWVCLVEEAHRCTHSFGFCDDHFCYHPNSASFVCDKK